MVRDKYLAKSNGAEPVSPLQHGAKPISSIREWTIPKALGSPSSAGDITSEG